MVTELLEHLNKLRLQAIESRKEHTNDFKKYEKYYTGKFKQGQGESNYNIVKGIIDTKTSFILDNNIVSSVVPRTKSFADFGQITTMQSIADILKDCNENILKNNNWDKTKRTMVKNANIYGFGVSEVVWNQDEEDNLGDIKINVINPFNFYPDLSAKEIQDCNYVFVKEVYSSITLKKKYPQVAERIKPTQGKETEVQSYLDKKPTSTSVTNTNDRIDQVYNFGEDASNAIQESKNVTVWKCYLKDDSTFLDEKDGSEELRYKYPNGRVIQFVEGAADYLLEDKAIDYPFGFPFVVLSTNEELLGDSPIKYITDIQDRINKAFNRIRYLISAFVSLLVYTPYSGISKNSFINQATLQIDDMSEIPQVVTNNTLSELVTMVDYIKFLKEAAYEIARVNPHMISGERQKGVTSGDMVDSLNESPMTSIREMQRVLKDWVIELGNKTIVLAQLFYNLPRFIRISEGKQYVKIPQRAEGAQIEVYERGEEGNFELLKELKGDLSIGKYEVEVIAGSEMPRSRIDKANITMRLAEMGVIDPQSTEGTDIILTALDYPDKRAVMDVKEEQSKDVPKITIPLDLAGKIFKDMPMQAQDEFLTQFGFEPLTQEQGAIEQMKELK